MFCPACAQRLEDNARVLSLHSIEVISRPPMLGVGSSSGGSSSSWANEGGVIFSKHTVGAGSGATSSFGNGLFIAGAAQSSGESKGMYLDIPSNFIETHFLNWGGLESQRNGTLGSRLSSRCLPGQRHRPSSPPARPHLRPQALTPQAAWPIIGGSGGELMSRRLPSSSDFALFIAIDELLYSHNTFILVNRCLPEYLIANHRIK
jgi:hypothetical protein